MATFELFVAGVYKYTLGMEEDPSEAIEAEQQRGARRVSIIKVEGGRRTPYLAGDDSETEDVFGYDEEENEEYA